MQSLDVSCLGMAILSQIPQILDCHLKLKIYQCLFDIIKESIFTTSIFISKHSVNQSNFFRTHYHTIIHCLCMDSKKRELNIIYKPQASLMFVHSC